MTSMSHDELLKSKEAELQVQLEAWSKEENILNKDQVIVLSLRIEDQSPTIQTDDKSTEPLIEMRV